MRTPTSRSLELLRQQGYLSQKVEQWVKFGGGGGIRRDLFGCVDILAIDNNDTIGVQACAGASHSARVIKAMTEPKLVTWLRAKGRRFIVHSWSKKGARGKRKLWTVRTEELYLSKSGFVTPLASLDQLHLQREESIDLFAERNKPAEIQIQ